MSPTPEQVREAAARLRRVWSGSSVRDVYQTSYPHEFEVFRRDENTLAKAWVDEHHEPNPAHEETAARFRAEQLAGDGKPDGTRKGLGLCARMLDTYAPDLYPTNELGQVHFARAMMESAADTITAFLKNDPSEDLFKALLAIWQWQYTVPNVVPDDVSRQVLAAMKKALASERATAGQVPAEPEGGAR